VQGSGLDPHHQKKEKKQWLKITEFVKRHKPTDLRNCENPKPLKNPRKSIPRHIRIKPLKNKVKSWGVSSVVEHLPWVGQRKSLREK
jgi:hypothetical protein